MLLDTSSYHAALDARFAGEIRARPITTTAGHPRPRTQDDFTVVTRIDEALTEAQLFGAKEPLTTLRSLKLGGVPVRAPDIRLRKLTLPPALAPKVMGLLGVVILGANGTIIDFPERSLFFYPRR